MSEPVVPPSGFGTNDPDLPSGEDQGIAMRFSAAEIADAFAVGLDRVERALAGELGRFPGDHVDSRQAQDLAEALLADRPLAEREAALMQLGAFRGCTNRGGGDVAMAAHRNAIIREGLQAFRVKERSRARRAIIRH